MCLFQLYVESESGSFSRQLLWHLVGQQGNAWLRGEVVNITATSSWRFVFESFRGDSFRGDVTLDGLAPSLGCEKGSELIVVGCALVGFVQHTVSIEG